MGWEKEEADSQGAGGRKDGTCKWERVVYVVEKGYQLTQVTEVWWGHSRLEHDS